MAKETLSELVHLLWNGFYDLDAKTLKDGAEDYLRIARQIQAADFGDLGKKERLLPNMLNLMGYSDEGVPLVSTASQKHFAKQFRGVFWSLPECYEYFLEGLLASGQKDSAQMKAIFKSFEDFYSETMAGSRKWHYLAERVLDYACEDIAMGSNWFSKYYALSDVIEPQNKRIEVVYYNLLHAPDYYSEDEEGLKRVLKIQDPERKVTLYEKMRADLQEKANSLRVWLGENYPRLVSFFSMFAPVWTPTNWKRPDVPSLRLVTKVYSSQDRVSDLMEPVLIEAEMPAARQEAISGNNTMDLLLNQTPSLLKLESEAVLPVADVSAGNNAIDLRLDETPSLFKASPVSVKQASSENEVSAPLGRASLQDTLDLLEQTASLIIENSPTPLKAASRQQRSQSCPSFFQERSVPMSNSSEDCDSGFSPIKRRSVSVCSLDETTDTEVNVTDQEESSPSSSPRR